MGREDMRLDSLRVLVADDNEDQCENIKEMLRQIGAYAQYAINASQAVEKTDDRENPAAVGRI